MEALLWFSLGVASAVVCRSGYLGFHLACATTEYAILHLTASAQSFWRSTSASSRNESQGLFMSSILITCLLHVVARYNDHWTIYAKIASPFLLHPTSMSWSLLLLLGVVAWFDTPLQDLKVVAFIGLWIVCFHSIRLYSSMMHVWTPGEWAVVSCVMSIAFTEMMTPKAASSLVRVENEYQLVALAGVVGCVVGCAIAAKIPSAAFRIIVLVGSPLAVVELMMCLSDMGRAPPRCMNWIAAFLLETENSSLLSISRFGWLLYWGIVLVATVPVSTLSRFTRVAPAVVTRKWFHLIAILLFTPVTLYSPQLMALAYAVALCGLMVLECLRPLLPEHIQGFYLNFLDPDKDKADRVIISHMALIFGCAFPMWTSTLLSIENPLLRLWGVLVLGVGDSFGALVGTRWGKTKWGHGTQKSVEGSVGMLVSMGLCCSVFGDSWISAVFFTTLLEAFTCQIDNLVLPLAGVVVILLDGLNV